MVSGETISLREEGLDKKRMKRKNTKYGRFDDGTPIRTAEARAFIKYNEWVLKYNRISSSDRWGVNLYSYPEPLTKAVVGKFRNKKELILKINKRSRELQERF